MPKTASSRAATAPRFAPWRVLTWMLALLAAFGILEYSMGLWHASHGLARSGLSDAARAGLEHALWGNLGYLLVACAGLCLSAATLMHKAWARPALRVLAGVLALWFLATAGLWIAHWLDFRTDAAAMVRGGQANAAVREVLARVERSYMVGLVLKLVAALALAWLGWSLGRPQVRAQFPPARTIR